MTHPDRLPPRIRVAVCTHRRNEPLRRLLEALLRNQERLGRSADLGVVIADDNDDGRAAPIAAEFGPQFRLGVRYVHVGSGNISVARNAALARALPDTDWIAMTDDDCVPVDEWIGALLAVQRSTAATAVTGPCVLCVDDDAPRWIREQPFLGRGAFEFPDRAPASTAATNNSMVDAAFLRDRPGLRFRTDLGRVGGEDMVFYRSARAEGMQINFARDAVVHGVESPERATLGYQIRSHLWLGNTEFVTNSALGEVSRPHWAARSVKQALAAVVRPIAQMASGAPPQCRYSLALLARASGMMLGVVGVRLAHR